MPKTKITTVEIQSLIAFGKELDKRMKQARIGFTELSNLTGDAVSPGYISDIVRAGRGDSQKYFRLGRGKVVPLAKALEWDTDEALDLAGFKSAERAQADTIEEALDSAFYFDQKGLTEPDRATLRPLLQVADREVERLRSQPAPTRLSRTPTTKIQSPTRERDDIDRAIDAALTFGGQPATPENRQVVREIFEQEDREKELNQNSIPNKQTEKTGE